MAFKNIWQFPVSVCISELHLSEVLLVRVLAGVKGIVHPKIHGITLILFPTCITFICLNQRKSDNEKCLSTRLPLYRQNHFKCIKISSFVFHWKSYKCLEWHWGRVEMTDFYFWGWTIIGGGLTAFESVSLGFSKIPLFPNEPLKIGRMHSLLFCLLFSYPHSREKIPFHGAPAFVAWTKSKLRALVCTRKVKLMDQ